jgi:hypothetical protein
MILPRRRYQLILDAPITATHGMITVPYLQQPVPVYSDYGFYSLPMMGDQAIINYAAWLIAYRDKDVSYGDRFYMNWERLVTDSVITFNRTTNNRVRKPRYYI